MIVDKKFKNSYEKVFYCIYRRVKEHFSAWNVNTTEFCVKLFTFRVNDSSIPFKPKKDHSLILKLQPMNQCINKDWKR